MGENDEDMLQFTDSERESVLGYLEGNDMRRRVDTPTRILNNSNEFLPVSSLEIKVLK